MRMIRRLWCAVAVGVFAFGAGAQSLPDPQNSTIYLNDPEAAAQRLVGRGVALPGGLAARAAFDTAGNEIVWREVRRSTDPLGNGHVFYRQYVVADTAATELFGSEVGVHTRASGEFAYVGGTQFEIVSIANRPRLTPFQALRRGSERLRAHRGEDFERVPSVMDDVVTHRLKETRRVLVQDGTEFRYAYFTFAEDARGGYHEVIVDAENGRLLGTSNANPGGNCFASNPSTVVTAIGVPVRAGVPNRTLQASPVSTRPAPFTHEGFWLASSTAWPSSSVYQQTTMANFKCDVNVTTSYTLFPLTTNANGVPVYDDVPGTPWNGRAAGDALYHTWQTMRAFATLGRDGWNGSGAEARIIVDSTAGNLNGLDTPVDTAQYIRTPKDGRSPADVVVIGNASQFYNLAASLDLVAHEWGHGVIFDEVNLSYSTNTNQQIHEGMADVIGNIVEKLRQPAGGGLEQSSDWKLQEDSADGGYARGAYDDGASHNWVGPYGTRTLNDQIHRDDSYGSGPPSHPNAIDNHGVGNMLTMAYRLMAEGGKNPICYRGAPDTGYSGCDTTVVGVGVTKANRIMFQALYEMPSTVGWTTIANYVNQAAYEVYGGCAEQKAVWGAFKAIGYPRTVSPLGGCPQEQ